MKGGDIMKEPLWAGVGIIPPKNGEKTKERYHCPVCPDSECFIVIGLSEDEPKKCIKEKGGEEHGRKTRSGDLSRLL